MNKRINDDYSQSSESSHASSPTCTMLLMYSCYSILPMPSFLCTLSHPSLTSMHPHIPSLISTMLCLSKTLTPLLNHHNLCHVSHTPVHLHAPSPAHDTPFIHPFTLPCTLPSPNHASCELSCTLCDLTHSALLVYSLATLHTLPDQYHASYTHLHTCSNPLTYHFAQSLLPMSYLSHITMHPHTSSQTRSVPLSHLCILTIPEVHHTSCTPFYILILFSDTPLHLCISLHSLPHQAAPTYLSARLQTCNFLPTLIVESSRKLPCLKIVRFD